MQLEERQLIIFIHHLGVEHVGVQTFDPQHKGRQSDFVPTEAHASQQPALDIQPKS